MNLKRISSALLVVAMLLTLFSIPTFAAGEQLLVTYDNISNPAQAIKVGDQFWMNVTFKGINTYFAGSLVLAFDTDKIQTIASSGSESTTTTCMDTQRMTSAVKVDQYVDDEPVNATCFIQSDFYINKTVIQGKTIFAYAVEPKDIILEEGGESMTYAYTLTTTQKTNGLLMVRIRCKALASGNANVAFVTDTDNGNLRTKMQLVKGGSYIYPAATDVTALTIQGLTTEYNVTGSVSGGNGNVAPDFAGGKVTEGSQAVFTVTPADGYELDTVNDAPATTTGSAPNLKWTSAAITADTTFTFKFKAINGAKVPTAVGNDPYFQPTTNADAKLNSVIKAGVVAGNVTDCGFISSATESDLTNITTKAQLDAIGNRLTSGDVRKISLFGSKNIDNQFAVNYINGTSTLLDSGKTYYYAVYAIYSNGSCTVGSPSAIVVP